MKIRITSTPPGEAPEHIRQAWVGLVLPVHEHYNGPQTRLGVGVLTGPRTWLGVLLGILTGRAKRATGYVVENCNPEAFFKFTAGHSSWELLGAVISGMAGMKLGLAALFPGRYRRAEAIRQSAKAALPLILGAAAMTVVAAMIEGFWSAQSLPPSVKYSFGIFWWVFLAVYFSVSGRRSQALE